MALIFIGKGITQRDIFLTEGLCSCKYFEKPKNACFFIQVVFGLPPLPMPTVTEVFGSI